MVKVRRSLERLLLRDSREGSTLTDRVPKNWVADGLFLTRLTSRQSARHLEKIMNREEALKKSDDALQELANALKQGKSEQLLSYLDTLSRFHRYSFGNCILIALQRPEATFVAGFQRWKQMGRWVKKDEKGIAILAPVLNRKKKVEQEEGEEPEERPARTVRGFKVAHVFDVSQTDGKELPEFASLAGDPGEKTARLVSIIEERGISLEFVETLGGANGCSMGGMIKVVKTLPPSQTFSTLTHELAHELLHQGDRRQHTTKAVRETEAEAVAYVVCRWAGIDCSTRAADYIQLWNGDEKVLMQSLELIRDVATAILTELDGNSESSEVPEQEMQVA